MGIRMVAMDLDGTLLGSDHKVSRENAEALRACEAKGIKMVLASGRKYESVRNLALELELISPIISCNGARADETPSGPPILEDMFSLGLSTKVYEIMRDSGLYFVCYGHGKVYQNNIDVVDQRRGLSNSSKKADSDDGHVTDVGRMLAEGLHNPYKYVAFSDDSARLAVLRERLERETPCNISSSWRDNVEVLSPGAGKDRAIRALCAHFDISIEEVMAFGDQSNDMGMLKAVGVPVAMENAVEELKAVAKIIAPHHTQSGVGAVLQRYILSPCAT